jgi:hypothetical protein
MILYQHDVRRSDLDQLNMDSLCFPLHSPTDVTITLLRVPIQTWTQKGRPQKDSRRCWGKSPAGFGDECWEGCFDIVQWFVELIASLGHVGWQQRRRGRCDASANASASGDEQGKVVEQHEESQAERSACTGTVPVEHAMGNTIHEDTYRAFYICRVQLITGSGETKGTEN